MIFIVLGKFTQQGKTTIKDSPARTEAVRNVVKSNGGEMKETYYTMGRYDFISIIEAPDNEAMTKIMFTIGSWGNVNTETLPAVAAPKASALLKSLP